MKNPFAKASLKQLEELTQAKTFQTDKDIKILEKIDQLSETCDHCQNYLIAFEKTLDKISDEEGEKQTEAINAYHSLVKKITSHLTKKHKIVKKGYYLSLYMPLGTSLGVVFGLLLFDNLALGIPIGVGLGLAIGSLLDEDAKKKGLTI